MFTACSSVKWRNLLRRPEASLCIDTKQPPYRVAIVRGVVAESDGPLLDIVLRMAISYYGEQRGRDYQRSLGDAPGSVLFKLTPASVMSWDDPGDE